MDYTSVNKREKKEKSKIILYAMILCLIADEFFLRLLPKFVALIAKYSGQELRSSDLLTKYCMGIGVRVVGILVFIYLIRKMKFDRWFTYRIKKEYFLISWLFIIYIFTNIEIGDFGQVSIVTVLCMVLEAMCIGFFEELVFRGTILTMFLEKFHSTKKEIVFSVVTSSLIFGVFHLSNLFTNGNVIEVFSQVIYTFIIGIAFSALYVRTNNNLLWCCILHGLFDMASGFGDFTKVVEQEQAAAQETISIMPYLINIGLFLPLLVYSLFLLRKAECKIVTK
ncbi:CPBP family intramembrane glutamic endopeptidase [Anaerosporobacter faecicola]|uniref:CPBP family intramembrane glutamic endopeptidase n=1 Tax=Anaerosporobacter faecicola TaxID=2718714 RepID=UPI00143C81A5|nr:CPBP family intramembrane glutamic endopeptidase [Anaerosporobacter faecicola]